MALGPHNGQIFDLPLPPRVPSRTTSKRTGRHRKPSPRSLHGLNEATLLGRRPPPRKLSLLQYCVVVGATILLAAGQFFFLPKNLSVADFGLTILALSLLQAALQFADLGFFNASLRSDLSAVDRTTLRKAGVSIAWITCVSGMLAATVASITVSGVALLAVLAFVCALLVVGDKARGSAAVHLGDEVRATRNNTSWQNSPKLGSIIGSFGHSALLTMAGAAVSAALFSRPAFPNAIDLRWVRKTARFWGPGLAVAATAFIATWAETYVLSISAPIASVGQYQAVVRPLTGVTYLYLPVVSLIQAASNSGRWSRARKLTAAGISIGFTGSTLVGLAMFFFGRQIWPDFDFRTDVIVFAAVASFGMCISALLGTHLLLLGKHVAAATNSAIGAIALLVAAIVLVPSGGEVGAAVSSSLAWTIVVACHCFTLWRNQRKMKSEN